MDLETVFLKACRLLRSKAKESTEQLRQLLDESLHQHSSSLSSESTTTAATTTTSSSSSSSSKEATTYHGKVSSSNLVKKQSPKHVPVEVKRQTGGGGPSRDVEEAGSRKVYEKRTYDKVRPQEASSDGGGLELAKRQRTDQPSQKPVIGRQSPAVYSPSSSNSASSSSSSIKDVGHAAFEANPSAADIAVELGLVCVLCRLFDVSSGNTLVECQDCHALYHQECHKPPIPERDVNDPRLVWYCAKCTKNMKKMASKTQKSVKPQTVSLAKESTTASKPNKQSEVLPTAQQPTHIFKRVEPKVAVSSTTHPPTSSGNKPIGLAGLAASLSGKSQKTTQPSSQKPITSAPKAILASTKPTQPTGDVKAGAFANLYSGGNNGGSGSISSGGNSSLSSVRSTSSSAGSSSSVTIPPSSAKPSGSSSLGGNGSGAAALAAASKSGASSSSIMSADKRLQIMKKKAAAKMQEKRRLSSK